ncbi:LuxR family transcriptional regulator [Pseudoxanthomonas sp. 10H]|uniref:LuxR family transcriptional regulator n=1 Tax=Pseudoxanthomonas sp. 10H TaxID=3242729 RepID=UPI0035564F20
MLALQATAAAAGETPAATSPLVGRWAIDVASLPMPPEARPKRVALEFQDPGNGQWFTRVEIVHPGGEVMRAEASLPLDGTPGRVSGNYWADVSAMKMPAPGVLVMQLVDHGAPASTRVYTVSADGARLTETKAFFGRDGTPVLQTITFHRLP